MLFFKKFLFLFLFILSCTFTPRNEIDQFPEKEIETSSSSGEIGSSSGMTSSSSSSSDGGLKFDVNPANIALCEKIDFLFVIDNSGSMQDNQANLIENFKGFIDGIKSITGFGDFHIGVITTDGYAHNGQNCGVIGGLVTKTGGGGSSAQTSGLLSCGPWSEGNYMLLSEIEDPITGFPCVAQVGISGSGTEMPVQAFLSSLGQFLNSEDQCNYGFYRDDAKLIVIFITDEEDSSSGSLLTWLQEVEFYKKDLNNVVVLGLVPIPESTCASGILNTKLKDFILSFPYSDIGDICSDDYETFFIDAIDVIENACNPVG